MGSWLWAVSHRSRRAWVTSERMVAPTSCTNASDPPALRTAAITAAESAGVHAETVLGARWGRIQRRSRYSWRCRYRSDNPAR
jgi:hypothetical protein